MRPIAKQDPPNAALSIDSSPRNRDVFLLTLKNPRLIRGRLTYTVAPLKGAFLEGNAVVGQGWSVQATISGVTQTWSSGNISAPLF